MEHIIRSRRARIGLAGFLLAVGLWAFSPYLLHRVSSSAFVNAELVRVTSPIAGRLTLELPAKGHYLSQATTVPLVEAPNPDRRQLALYEQEAGAAATRIELALAQIATLEESDRQLGERLESYRRAILERLRRESDEAHANLKACNARREETAKQRQRIESLAKTGFASNQRLEEVQSAHASASANCEAAMARVNRLASASGAATEGIFLQDGYNDTPYSQQQRDRLILRRQEIDAELLRESTRLAHLETEIERERLRFAQASRYELLLPAGHVVWTLTSSPGATVVEGQTIMDLANCLRRFIIVELPERDFESVTPGGRATVRLLGADEWIEARVEQVLGSAARQDERLLAARAPKAEGPRVTVEIGLATESLPPETGRYCDIGRMAEVRIDRHGPRLFGAAIDSLARFARRLGQPSSLTLAADSILAP